jgi:hypothetical protein
VLNLLANAIKFTAHGGTVTLTAELESAAVAIRVSDTGRGIPADKLTPFFSRSSRSGRRARSRTGRGSDSRSARGWPLQWADRLPRRASSGEARLLPCGCSAPASPTLHAAVLEHLHQLAHRR